MKILIWNINALAPTVKNFVLKHGSTGAFFESYGADIVCFQETKLMEEKLTRDLACVENYESFWAFSQTKKGYSGVATFAREAWSPVAAEIDDLGVPGSDLNGEGRYILTDHGSFVLIHVYVPNAGKKGEQLSDRGDLKVRFLRALKAKCDSLQEAGRKVIIVGDLNIAASAKDVHPSMDWGKMYHPEEIAAFRALLSGLTDVWRLQNPDATDCFTVWDEKTSARSVNRGLRIDYVLVTGDLLPGAGPCSILDTPFKWSDHAALLFTLEGVEPPGPHQPLPQSSRRMKKFDTRSQPSVASMFARKKPPSAQGVEGVAKKSHAGAKPAAVAASPGGGANALPKEGVAASRAQDLPQAECNAPEGDGRPEAGRTVNKEPAQTSGRDLGGMDPAVCSSSGEADQRATLIQNGSSATDATEASGGGVAPVLAVSRRDGGGHEPGVAHSGGQPALQGSGKSVRDATLLGGQEQPDGEEAHIAKRARLSPGGANPGGGVKGVQKASKEDEAGEPGRGGSRVSKGQQGIRSFFSKAGK